MYFDDFSVNQSYYESQGGTGWQARALLLVSSWFLDVGNPRVNALSRSFGGVSYRFVPYGEYC